MSSLPKWIQEIKDRADGIVRGRMMMDKSKTIELTPCPFCGGEAIIADTYGPYAIVSCKSCPCAVEVYGSMKYAVEAWNRRVGDVLDELCDQCYDHLVVGDWVTIDDRKLCSLCAYVHEKDKIKEGKR